MKDRRQLIKRHHESLSVRRQCELMNLNRSSYYYEPRGESEETLALMRKIDEIYTKWPFFGSRRIRAELGRQGIAVSRGRISRLMRLMNIEGKLPGKRTTQRAPGHRIYPNLLRDQQVTHAGQVWCSDITYLPMRHGTMYLVAILDWHSRYVLSWALSNTLESDLCIRALEEALHTHGRPEVFHSDQGCQYTSKAFTSILERHGTTISMSGRGRAYDNIFIERFWRSLKYEEIYKHDYESVQDLREAVDKYIDFYNRERPHQALDYQVPKEVHITGLDESPSTAHRIAPPMRAQAAFSAPPTSFDTHSRSGRPERARAIDREST